MHHTEKDVYKRQGNQLLTHIVINIESAVIFRGGKVAEYKLCSFCISVILPDTVHILSLIHI